VATPIALYISVVGALHVVGGNTSTHATLGTLLPILVRLDHLTLTSAVEGNSVPLDVGDIFMCPSMFAGSAFEDDPYCLAICVCCCHGFLSLGDFNSFSLRIR